ncbi:MAG: M23 family metallopeptidase [Actinobacteria bacterium]|nr:M23 family metallopeptidase [Actinomycetota bacterium]MCB8996438.1 M23 family metallopeptidase [Actinomycetota bacterium]
MRTALITLAMTAAAGGAIVAPASAAPAPEQLDFIGQSVDYPKAAKAELLTVPTKGYKISARFGQSGPMWSSGRHTGLDFAAPEGRTILAADSGRVVSASPAGAYGNMIEIAHGNGMRTRYAHLSDIDVKVGQKVSRGDHIGNLGNTGNSSGPHLHFEVLVKGEPVDPEKHLGL